MATPEERLRKLIRERGDLGVQIILARDAAAKGDKKAAKRADKLQKKQNKITILIDRMLKKKSR